ncbi:MAG TPA: hypothetical protein PK504_05990 [Ferruginibacter sp.]|nr:hypothetical protein [Ferruginibacter sp.]HRE64227.1 hypothetical protein [Ferruginibacter sp.]
MRKCYKLFLLAAFLIFAAPNANAQTFTIEGGTSGNHLYNLLYTWYLAPRTQRLATHIPASQIAAGGLTSGATISSIELERLVGAGDNLSFPVGAANVKIYLENREPVV